MWILQVKIWFQNRRARERRDKRVDFCAATCTAAEDQTSSHIVLPASTAPGQNTDTDKAIVSPHNSSAGNMWSCPGSIFHAHHSILQHHQMKATTSHDDRKQTSLQQQVKDERIGNIMSYDDSDHINWDSQHWQWTYHYLLFKPTQERASYSCIDYLSNHR